MITEWLFCLNTDPSCLDKPNVKPSMGSQRYVVVKKAAWLHLTAVNVGCTDKATIKAVLYGC